MPERATSYASILQEAGVTPDPFAAANFVPGAVIDPNGAPLPDQTPPPTDEQTEEKKLPKKTGILWWLGLSAAGVGLVWLAVRTPVGAVDDKKKKKLLHNPSCRCAGCWM